MQEKTQKSDKKMSAIELQLITAARQLCLLAPSRPLHSMSGKELAHSSSLYLRRSAMPAMLRVRNQFQPLTQRHVEGTEQTEQRQAIGFVGAQRVGALTGLPVRVTLEAGW